MKIGIDVRLWNETGVGRYIRNLVSNLQTIDRNNDYVLFANKNFKFQFSSIKNDKWKIVETDIHWHSVSEQLKFPQIINKENLDLVHFPYFSLPIFYNKPFVVTIHDLIIDHFSTGKASTLPYPLYLLKRIGYKTVMNNAVKNSQRIIVPLNSVKEDLMKTYRVAEDKVIVTYEGCSKLKTQNSKLQFKAQSYFLYVGNAYPHKNLDFLIKAFTEFKKEMEDDIKLVLIGNDDYFYKRLRNKIEKENLANVLLVHDVSDRELFNLYANAIAFVSASKMEGFGLPPLEAMSSSCPVLLSDIPSFKEVCRDAAFYFDFNSKNSLKEKMSLVYNLDSKEKQKYIRKGLERVEDFSWKKMAEETLKVYESCPSASSG